MKTIDAGTINAIELVFVRSLATLIQDDRRYLLQIEGLDYLETMKRFPSNQVTRTTRYYIDDTDGEWFAFSNVDCFDPPFAIIRARTLESAYECFCDEFESWIKVDDADAQDYPEDERAYNAGGTHIDASNVQGHPLFLLSARLA